MHFAAGMQQHFHASHKGVALNPSVYAQPWAVWPCGGGTRPGEARNWGADQPRSTCVERTYDWTHMQTRKHTRTYAYTHTSPFPASSSFPVPPVVLVTAIRPCHRLSLISRPCHCHSCWSPPVVDQSSLSPPAIRPCHCLLAAIRPFRRVSPPFVSPGQPRPRSGSRILVAWAAQRGDAYR